MANEYLNKATDSTGSVIYTASEKDVDGKPTTRVYFDQPQPMQLTERKVQQQLTESDAVTGTLTFSENIDFIGIFNTDQTNTGIFNVNGLDIHVPPGESFSDPIGGAPRATVNVTGATSYIVTRYK